MEKIKIFKIGEEGNKELFQSPYSFFENTFDFVIDENKDVFKKIFNRTTHRLKKYESPVEIVSDRMEIRKEAENILLKNTEEFLKEVGKTVSVTLKHKEKGYVRGAEKDSYTNTKILADKYILTLKMAVDCASEGLQIDSFHF